MSAFTKATKKKARARVALESPAGFGKTYTSLLVASQLVEGTGKRIAFLDTEGRGQGSASKYAHLFDFDVDEIKPPFHPDRVIESIADAVSGDYGVWIVDSWSHFWTGKGGMLDIVDQIARAKYRGDTHSAWKDAGEIEQRLLDAMLGAPLHVIVCMRMKTDTVREEVEGDGKKRTRIRAAGLKAVQRDGFDYEFDLVGQFETPTILTVAKTRVDTLPPDTFIEKPAFLGDGATEDGKAFVPKLKAWLTDGEPNIVLDRANEAQQKKLKKLVADLDSAGPPPGKFTDWQAVADAYANREFGHGITALTKPEITQTTTALAKYLEGLTANGNGAEANGAVAQETAQEVLA